MWPRCEVDINPDGEDERADVAVIVPISAARTAPSKFFLVCDLKSDFCSMPSTT